MSEPVHVVRESDLVDGDPTPGMHRQVAFSSPSLWAGLVHTEPGAASGWHHHGDHETSLYVVSGAMRLDFGADGADSVEAGPGDFVRVPPHTVHRESNPGDARSTAVIGRAGGPDAGPPTVNVDGPQG